MSIDNTRVPAGPQADKRNLGLSRINCRSLSTANEADPTGATGSPAAELEALIERLERVTSRLERLPLLRARSSSPPRSPAPSPVSSPTLEDAPAPLPPANLIVSDSMSVNGYQDLVQVSSGLLFAIKKKLTDT